jgi:hypothetical protein
MHAGHDLAGAENLIASCQRSSAQLGHSYQSISGENSYACMCLCSIHARAGRERSGGSKFKLKAIPAQNKWM